MPRDDERQTRPENRRPSITEVAAARERLRQHPGAEPGSLPPSEERSKPPPPSSRRSFRPSAAWLGALAAVGKWLAAASAPFLAAGALWLYARVETEKARAETERARAAKLQAEATAIDDARAKLAGAVAAREAEQKEDKERDETAAKERSALREKVDGFGKRLDDFDETWTEFLRANPDRRPARPRR